MRSHDSGRGGRPSPKTLQLCAQAFHALSYALGDSDDPILLDTVLERVEPLQGDRHLLVVVRDPVGHGPAVTLAALDRARGFLRTAVAEAIYRSKAPQLSFTVAPPGEEP